MKGIAVCAWSAVALVLGVLATSNAEPAEWLRALDSNRYHLGTFGQPEWQEFVGQTPHGRRLDLRFAGQTNSHEATLFIRQDDVKLEWGVELNGRKIGKLFLMEAPLVFAMPVPMGALRDGDNILSITPPKDIDDIMIGGVKLDSRPLKEALNQATLDVQVLDAESRNGLPCRLTIVNKEGALAPFFAGPDQELAARPGVVYTRDGHARLGVPPGDYTIYATRGFEYSLGKKKVSIAADQTRQVKVQIRREVPTLGLVSCDTHVHTFTYSKHGDATIDERMITLAGEGIELPIATDHNCLTDYSEPARRMKVRDRFTPVIGCEVTTDTGHFNVFPIESNSRVPDFKTQDWPKLMESIRSTPGVRVAVLNHPRNIHNHFQPFAATNFNAATGENLRGPEFSFDAIEVANSSALQSDLNLAFRDWFALLNYGYRVTAVGSSDGHDVSRYIVGQGRSYVVCDDRDASKINVDQACQSFRAGRVLVSMGLLAQMTVDGKFGVGDLATGIGEKMRVTVTVLGPSWINADRVELFANGVKIREQRISTPNALAPSAKPAIEKAKITWNIPRPPHDMHLVAIAWGPPVTGPYWAIPKPYQPNSRVWQPHVIGATNPIWIDADGDGTFTSARGYAKRLIQENGTEPAKLLPALTTSDESVAAQAASFCQSAGRDVRSADFVPLLKKASTAVQRGFSAFAATLSAPQ